MKPINPSLEIIDQENISQKRKGFTLVELIIVITILAILATIAFISFQGYARQSRDSNRLTTIKTIEKGVDLFMTKSGKIPVPDEAKSFTGGSATNPVEIKQGYVGAQMIQAINMNQIPLDPKTQAKYHYSVFGDKIYYQIGIEQEQDPVSYISPTFAESEEVMISGNYRLDPSLPSLFVVKDSVGAGGIFDLNTCFIVDGWENNFASSSGNCVNKSQMLENALEKSLVGYWDMETTTGGKLKDLSGNGNDGVFTGYVLPTLTGAKIGKGCYFNSGGFIRVESTDLLNIEDNITLILKYS